MPSSSVLGLTNNNRSLRNHLLSRSLIRLKIANYILPANKDYSSISIIVLVLLCEFLLPSRNVQDLVRPLQATETFEPCLIDGDLFPSGFDFERSPGSENHEVHEGRLRTCST